MPLSSGEIINSRYRIIDLLGQGGFGAVYRVWDLNLERPRALKENLDISPEAQRQFKREAQLLSDLSHPNLPKVFDHFAISGQGQYLVMEYVEGEDLQAMVERTGGPLPEGQALAWIGQICEALTYLHTRNPPIIHRDIKPGNIKIRLDGRALLVDFGIAKIYDPVLRTTAGAQAVTPGYSPVEQYGQGITDARSDIYALGATAYYTLTGQHPAASVDIMIRSALAPAPVSALNRSISPQTSAAIERAMQLERQNRWQSASEFSAALRQPARTELVTPVGMAAPVASAAYQSTQAVPAREPIPAPRERAGKLGPFLWGCAAITGMVVLALSGLLIWVLSGRSAGGVERPSPTLLATLVEATLTQPASSETPTPLSTQTLPSTPTEPPEPTGDPSRLTDERGLLMALVPAGAFQMGSEKEESEQPVHEVTLDAFYIDVYEATNGSYVECVRDGSCQPPVSANSKTRPSYFEDSTYASYPMINVTWSMAQAYCQWRGARLPSEAEWEKAARGGLDGMDYPWGNDKPVCRIGALNGACFWEPGNCDWTDTEKVGSYSPNGYGLYDMVGNVWEFVQDFYAPYESGAQTNPSGPAKGLFHAIRGGAWVNMSSQIRVSARIQEFGFEVSYFALGFRCARSP